MRWLGIFVGCWLAVTPRTSGACTPRFLQPVRYAVTADVVVLVADLDGDRRPEIVTSGNHVEEYAAFSLLPNLGGGAFGPERQIASAFGERLEDATDASGDGVPDLLAANYWANGIGLYRASGTLAFGPETPFGTATHGGPSRVVDYDGDGILDIVSLSFGSGNPVRVHLFRGKGDGTFEPKRTFDTSLANAASPSWRVHDGALEVLASEHSGHLGLLRISAAGVSWTRRDAGPGFDLTSVFADVDADGIADVVYTTDGDSETQDPALEPLFVRLGRPDGTFADAEQLHRPRQLSFPTELRTADLDGDGRADLVAGDFRASTLYWYRSNGSVSFDAGVAIAAGAPVNDFALADVNGDGRADVVTVNDDHSLSVILNDGGDCRPARRRAARH